ncbi:MAG TPA: L-glutamate gamma-semialdehyde dehydrogenase [Nitrospinota bacterium]|jgi:RHH-type proline utilization regulon transcriptional repressor/proline dehydrogenase/delta 1-pyrroline-5-carboxylate dehydrogenase|nr:L-glutamate gamma-semialdehyde dehydrogenase [Nitrospinota bacterium]
MKPLSEETEARIQEMGKRLLKAARERKQAFWAREHWEEILFHKLMDNEQLRAQLLRFVDVLPALTSDEDLSKHLHEYLGEEDLPIPGFAKWGIEHAQGSVAAHLAAGAVRTAMHGLAKRFIGGESVNDAFNTVKQLRNEKMCFTLDLLGEVTVSETEADEYRDKYLNFITNLAPKLKAWKPNPLLDEINGRPYPRFNLSIKVSSLCSQIDPIDIEGRAETIKKRLRSIFQAAKKEGAFICMDMEQYDMKEIILRVFKDILVEPEFRDWPDVGIALQAYLRDTEKDLLGLVDWRGSRGTPVTVRLVRGAYWDYEKIIAKQNQWDMAVWSEKWETDLCFENCTRHLMDNHPALDIAVGSHNVRSLALAMVLAEEKGLKPGQFELQMLYGMADPLKEVIAEMNQRTRIYVPCGELISGMAYMVRRLLENTASQSFLRMSFAEDLPAETLLAPPTSPELEEEGSDEIESTQQPPYEGGDQKVGELPPFVNEPVHRFTDEVERKAFAASIQYVRDNLGQEYPLMINGGKVNKEGYVVSINPARPEEVVGHVSIADRQDVERAIEAATSAFSGWRDLTAEKRADYLVRIAKHLRKHRDEFSAWQIFEAGKTWREADADVVEAIDFLEYYAREATRLSCKMNFNVPGENNEYFYQPRGVGVVISPWNFPLAILTGMLSASIVSGNTAILKPSSLTPVIAAKLMEVLRKVDLPKGVVNFLPGSGGEIGDYLVSHPKVNFIAFTGSQEVGCGIYKLAAEVHDGQTHLKRVIAEMGGKNAIIVDSNADMDDAVSGIVASAFGYQGQKCSAASRVIAVGDVHDILVQRLVKAVRSLRIGLPENPGSFMGAVIDEQAMKKIQSAIENGKKTADVALEVDVSSMGTGFFVGPTIFVNVPPESDLAQKEIFGPVLAIIQAKDFKEALDIASKTSYALTGGIYTRSPENMELARREFRVGNLYINRKISGAIVGRQPFGGFKMSGIGSKAGGPDYLLQFMEPRTVTENTFRRGFSPEEM